MYQFSERKNTASQGFYFPNQTLLKLLQFFHIKFYSLAKHFSRTQTAFTSNITPTFENDVFVVKDSGFRQLLEIESPAQKLQFQWHQKIWVYNNFQQKSATHKTDENLMVKAGAKTLAFISQHAHLAVFCEQLPLIVVLQKEDRSIHISPI